MKATTVKIIVISTIIPGSDFLDFRLPIKVIVKSGLLPNVFEDINLHSYCNNNNRFSIARM